MSIKLITGPSAEPVTLAEVKLALSIDGTDRDTRITKLIIAAREQAEHETDAAFITQTWELAVDAFPESEFRLPKPPLLSIVSVKYDDPAGVEQTLSSAKYTFDNYSKPGFIMPAYGATWPDTLEGANAVRVRYTAGYGPDATYVPERVKEWISVAVGSMLASPDGLVDSRLTAPAYIARLLDGSRVIAL